MVTFLFSVHTITEAKQQTGRSQGSGSSRQVIYLARPGVAPPLTGSRWPRSVCHAKTACIIPSIKQQCYENTQLSRRSVYTAIFCVYPGQLVVPLRSQRKSLKIAATIFYLADRPCLRSPNIFKALQAK